ncbi:MAG: hypothetical protein ACYC9N_22910 [Thermoanaerobaculia bacterium]
MDYELTQRIAELTDEELLALLTRDAADYRPEALELARSEAARRKLEIAPPAAPNSSPTITQAVRAFADGVAAEFRSGSFAAAGKPIICSHCGGEIFELRSAVVNTRFLTFFSLDWLNRGAAVLVCDACGLLTWFSNAPDRI